MPRIAASLGLLGLVAGSIGLNIARYPAVWQMFGPPVASAETAGPDSAPAPPQASAAPAQPRRGADSPKAAEAPSKDQPPDNPAQLARILPPAPVPIAISSNGAAPGAVPLAEDSAAEQPEPLPEAPAAEGFEPPEAMPPFCPPSPFAGKRLVPVDAGPAERVERLPPIDGTISVLPPDLTAAAGGPVPIYPSTGMD